MRHKEEKEGRYTKKNETDKERRQNDKVDENNIPRNKTNLHMIIKNQS